MSTLALEITGNSASAERALDTTRAQVDDFTDKVDEAVDATERLNSSAAKATRTTTGLGRSADDAGAAIDRNTRRQREQADASDAAGTAMAGSLGVAGRLGVAMGVATVAAVGLQRGFAMLRESADNYFASTEEGQLRLVEVQERFKGLRGALFETIIGTGDAEEAFARLVPIMDNALDVLDGLRVVVSPFASALRVSLAGGLSAAAAAARFLTGDLGELEEQLRATEAAQQAFTASQETGDTLSRLLAEDPLSALYRQREELAQAAASAVVQSNAVAYEQARVTAGIITTTRDTANMNLQQARVARDELRGFLEEVIVTGGDIDRALSASARSSNQGLGEQRTEAYIADVRSALATATFEVAGQTVSYATALDAVAQAIDAELDRENAQTTAREASTAASRSATSAAADQLAMMEAIGAASTAMGDALLAADALLYDLRVKAREQSDAAYLASIERTQAIEAATLEKRKADIYALRDAEIAAAEEAAQARERSQQRASAAIEKWAGSATDALADVVTGQADGEEAIKALTGEMLDAAANAAMLEAAMVFWQPQRGGPVAALGLIAAATAAKVGARALGAKGSTATPAAPTASAPSAPVNNTQYSIVVNAGMGTDPRGLRQELGGLIDDVAAGGYSRVLGS